jgi:hypothetical protein
MESRRNNDLLKKVKAMLMYLRQSLVKRNFCLIME